MIWDDWGLKKRMQVAKCCLEVTWFIAASPGYLQSDSLCNACQLYDTNQISSFACFRRHGEPKKWLNGRISVSEMSLTKPFKCSSLKELSIASPFFML
jgi:hypothetical protein